MNVLNILAWIATGLGITMFIPQVFKTIKTKNTQDLSKTTFTIVAFASACWTIYTISINPISWQGWVMNVVILVLMVPMLYLMHKKLAFFSIVIILFTMVLISFLLYFLEIKLNLVLQYIFVVIAGLGIAIPYYFQVYKTFKEKNVSSLSLLSLIFIFITNLMFGAYWLGRIILETRDNVWATFIIAFVTSIISGIAQLPLVYALLKYQNKAQK